ncbi:SDR family NAD(P)-dependent oxidoreductase [Streptomyces cavernae]|uniref:SDR family NAD(P)-dependent oxidoreductase n=1 Tax=Streptomyces cavernae TaxID=2259034 RepID=UPI001EE3FBA5|nr:SDR family NAD(P)-dependent oxidoreductase [Streptomyces cavernae]
MASTAVSPGTWFVTGTSRGLGLELVRQLLAQGGNVAATTRSAERLTAALGEDVDTSRFLPLTGNLTDEAQVENAVGRAVERFGRLDVVVNIRAMVDDHIKLQGHQLGDPVRGADAIIRRASHDGGPLPAAGL